MSTSAPANNDDLLAGLESSPEPAPAPARKSRTPKAAAPAAPAAPKVADRKRIIISESENANDVNVFVSVNGYAYNIRRGVEVEVPVSVLHVLDNAVESRIVKTAEGNHTLKSYQRFPYQVVG